MGFFDRLLGTAPTGAPATPEQRRRRGGNGASSFHLWWRFDDVRPPFQAVTATLQVTRPPAVPDLHFWALQADFVDAAGRSLGGAHTGLQHNPSSPGGAVNWGGYAAAGGELAGTASSLPGVDGGPNTRAYRFGGGAYRFVIDEGDVGWRATVTDLVTGVATPIRELTAPGSVGLATPLVWSEVFAPCGSASQVRWSDLAVLDEQGWHEPSALVPSYQAPSADGCPDTDSEVDPATGSVTQTTAAERRHPADVPQRLRR